MQWRPGTGQVVGNTHQDLPDCQLRQPVLGPVQFEVDEDALCVAAPGPARGPGLEEEREAGPRAGVTPVLLQPGTRLQQHSAPLGTDLQLGVQPALHLVLPRPLRHVRHALTVLAFTHLHHALSSQALFPQN